MQDHPPPTHTHRARQAPNLASQVGHTETHPMGHSQFLGPVCVWSGRMGLWVCRSGAGHTALSSLGAFSLNWPIQTALGKVPGLFPRWSCL